MIIEACVLYVVSLTGAGFVTDDCYVNETEVELYDPYNVYIVKELDSLPSGRIYYEVEESYVEYWTWPSVRIVYRSYPSYRLNFGTPYYRERRVINRRTVVRRPARKIARRTAPTRYRTSRKVVRSHPRRSYNKPRRRVTYSNRKVVARSNKKVRRQVKRSPQRKRNVSRRSRRSR